MSTSRDWQQQPVDLTIALNNRMTSLSQRWPEQDDPSIPVGWDACVDWWKNWWMRWMRGSQDKGLLVRNEVEISWIGKVSLLSDKKALLVFGFAYYGFACWGRDPQNNPNSFMFSVGKAPAWTMQCINNHTFRFWSQELKWIHCNKQNLSFNSVRRSDSTASHVLATHLSSVRPFEGMASAEHSPAPCTLCRGTQLRGGKTQQQKILSHQRLRSRDGSWWVG